MLHQGLWWQCTHFPPSRLSRSYGVQELQSVILSVFHQSQVPLVVLPPPCKALPLLLSAPPAALPPGFRPLQRQFRRP